MKRNRKFALLMVCVLLIGLLSGCTSAEKVMTKMVDNMAGKTAMKASFELPFEMEMTVAEETVGLSLNLDGTIWMSAEPLAMYGEINYEGDIADQWLSDQLQMYMAKEDDTYVCYYYSKLADLWTRVDSGMTDGDMQEYISKVTPIDYTSESLVLAEETQTVGGSEAYVVSYTFTGQELQNEFDAMGGFSGMMEKAMEQTELPEGMDMSAFAALDELDFTAVSMPVTMYIDKSTYTLKQMDMEYVGLQSFVEQFVDVIMQLAADMSGQDLSALGLDEQLSFEIPDISLKLTDLSYDNVEVKAVPEEGVILGKQASFVPLQEDGSYIVQEYGDAVRVVPYGGLEVLYSDYCTLQLGSTDGNTATYYSMLGSDWIEADITDYVASQVDALTAQGLKATIEDSTVGDFTVQTIKCQGIQLHNAWKQVGDGWIVVEAYDFYNGNQTAVLQNALDAVSAYTLP